MIRNRTNLRIKKKLGFIFSIIFLVFLVGFISAWVDNGEITQTVDDCGALNTTNGIYNLTINVNATNTCFKILANNITLDCAGYNINYSKGVASSHAINNTGYNFTTIKNCYITSGNSTSSSYAINFRAAYNGTIQNNTIKTTGNYQHGVLLATSSNTLITGNNFTMPGAGIWGSGVYMQTNSNRNNISLNNMLTTSGGFGTYMTGCANNTVNFNNMTLTGNTVSGITIQTTSNNNHFISNNIRVVSSGNGGYLINVDTSNSNEIFHNVVNSSTGTMTGAVYMTSSSFNNFTGNNVSAYATKPYFIVGTSAAHFNNSLDITNLANEKPLWYNASHSNKVYDSVDFENNYGQVIFANVNNVTISNSNISWGGIFMVFSGNSTIMNNLVNTSRTSDYGIYLYSSVSNNVSGNTVNTRGTDGYGIYLYSSSNNSVNHNLVSTNGSTGLGINLNFYSHNNSVKDNIVLTNGTSATGITLQTSSRQNRVINNTIITNTVNSQGIYLYSTITNSLILGNNIRTYGTNAYGMHIYTLVNHNDFINNTINTEGNTYSIYLRDRIHNNTFINMNVTGMTAALFIHSGSTNFTFKDSVLEASIASFSTGSSQGGYWNFTNVTRGNGDPMNITWGGGTGEASVNWYADIYVNYTNGTAVSGVNITTYNNNSVMISTDLTDTNGMVRQNLTEYIQNSTTTTNYNNYTFNATITGIINYTKTQSWNMSLNRNLIFTFDITPANATLTLPSNNTHLANGTEINLTANISDVGEGIKNATLNIYNSSSLVNRTTSTFAADTFSTTLGVVVSVVENVYTWFYEIFDFAGNFGVSSNYSLTVDLTKPLITFSSPTPADRGGSSSTISINVTINEINLANVTFYWDSTPYTYNLTDPEITSLGNGIWTFNTTNKSTLLSGAFRSYNLSVWDIAGNNNISETRRISGNTAPGLIVLTYNPNLNDTIDPGTRINVSANITDDQANFQTALLYYKNSTATWAQADFIRMTNLSINSTSQILNASFNTYNYEDYLVFRIFVNDTDGESANLTNYTISNRWDCTWNISTGNSDQYYLGATGGFYELRALGNLTIFNTGDLAYGTNNCSLRFARTSSGSAWYTGEDGYEADGEYLNFTAAYYLKSGNKGLRYYYNGSQVSSLTIPATQNKTLEIFGYFVKATSVLNEYPVIVIAANINNSDTGISNLTITGKIVITPGAYLETEIDSPASTLQIISLTTGTHNFKAYVKDVVDSSTNNNNTAYNVSFNWTIPAGLISLLSGEFNATYENLSDSNKRYLNLTLELNSTNLATLSQATYNLSVYAFGYQNSSGNLSLINHSSGNIISDSFSLTFQCYNSSDGTCVTACGYMLDPDCPNNPTTVASSSSSGGGGGGGGGISPRIEQSEATFELLRGDKQEFEFPITNKYFGNMKDIQISVSGINSQYISLEPSTVSLIEKDDSETIKVKITAPAYFSSKKYTLTFEIAGKLELNGTQTTFVDKRLVTLFILDVPRSEANLQLNESLMMFELLNSSGFNTKNLLESYNSLTNLYTNTDFNALNEIYDLIKTSYEDALEANQTLVELWKSVNTKEYEGISVSETKKLLYLAEVAFTRGDFSLALSRLKEARLVFISETKGEYNILAQIKNKPLQSLAILFAVSFAGLSLSLLGRFFLLRKKLRLLNEEEILLLELIKVVQRECFQSNKLSMEEYEQAMLQYEHRLSQAIEEKIRIETKLSNLLKFKGRKIALNEEKKRLVEMLKKAQDDYLNKGKLETRIYRNMLKSYSTRLTEVEEQLAFIEAQEAIKKERKMRGLFKI